MRIAVFSDVHANLPALQSVLEDIESTGVDVMVCLGDLVGYAPFPNEVVETVRDLGIPTIMGNYDQGVGFDLEDCGCAYRTEEEKALGQESLHWTRNTVTPKNKDFLRNLLPRYELEVGSFRFLFVHGSPRRINEYLFPDRPDSSFLHMMAGESANVLVCGHTHIPFFREVNGLFIANDGSVGRPKDGDWRAAWALLEVGEKLRVSFRRCEYDLTPLKEAYPRSGLPGKFLEDLLPSLGAH
ncbi:metallophosphoesterase family protein [Candidatus Caldatribacterium sp. SIUC1]|uniref:metallophosphoesterase family protein n=1 Tax=Candidatus Caldatribacterium sp. SIUC1 TaxID=3418365 RepID=UPI003F68CBB9